MLFLKPNCVPDTEQIYLITPVTHFYSHEKCHPSSVSRLRYLRDSNSGHRDLVTGHPLHPPPWLRAQTKSPWGDGGVAGVPGPGREEGLSPRAFGGFPSPFSEGWPDPRTIESTQPRAPLPWPPSDVTPLGVACRRGGATGEQPAREGLPGPAAPRSGRGRKRSRRPCGAGALTHGAQERERERKGQTWRLRSAPAEEGEAGGGLRRLLGSLLPPLDTCLLTSTSRPAPSCRLSSAASGRARLPARLPGP